MQVAFAWISLPAGMVALHIRWMIQLLFSPKFPELPFPSATMPQRSSPPYWNSLHFKETILACNS